MSPRNDESFSCKDPFKRLVCLDQNTWRYHIVDGHSVMVGRVQEVKRAVYSAEFITEDKNYPDRTCYYAHTCADLSLYLVKVVVEFDEHDEGDVITAFLVDRVDPAENVIWSNLSP